MPGLLVAAREDREALVTGLDRSARVAAGMHALEPARIDVDAHVGVVDRHQAVVGVAVAGRQRELRDTFGQLRGVGHEDIGVQRPTGEGVVHAEGHVAGGAALGEHQLVGQRPGIRGGADLQGRPVRLSNAAISWSGRAKDSWVTKVTDVGAAPLLASLD